METKDTLSSCSYFDEQDMQQMLKQAKILKVSFLNGLGALKSNFTRKLEQGITKSKFKHAFSHIFGEDVDTFTRTFSQNLDRLEQQLTKETILESNCQNVFIMLKTQFEKIFTSELIKPSSLDDTRPIYDEEPMAEVQTTAEINVFATRQQHTKQPEFNNEGEVDQNAEQCHDTLAKLLKEHETLKKNYKELFDYIKTMRAKTIKHTTSLIAQNAEFKAQRQEKGFAIATVKTELRKLTGNSMNTKFAKSSILGKPVLKPHMNQSVVRQLIAFKFERPRISKPQFASQVDVNNDLSKPVTTHYLPKERESVVTKPHHMIALSSSRYSSNDMVYNHYLEEAKTQTQEIGMNSKTSVIPYVRSQSTANGSKP
nr:hypothetical protein [Tanacetum cinerariifolium]